MKVSIYVLKFLTHWRLFLRKTLSLKVILTLLILKVYTLVLKISIVLLLNIVFSEGLFLFIDLIPITIVVVRRSRRAVTI